MPRGPVWPRARNWIALANDLSWDGRRVDILTYRAFTVSADLSSGNPAGVVLGAEALTDAEMLRIASDLGFSETAFLSEIRPDAARIRYFTPRAEIAFCGHDDNAPQRGARRRTK